MRRSRSELQKAQRVNTLSYKNIERKGVNLSKQQSRVVTVGLTVTIEMVSLLIYMHLENNILMAILLSYRFTSYNDYFLLPYSICYWGNSISEAYFFSCWVKTKYYSGLFINVNCLLFSLNLE